MRLLRVKHGSGDRDGKEKGNGIQCIHDSLDGFFTFRSSAYPLITRAVTKVHFIWQGAHIGPGLHCIVASKLCARHGVLPARCFHQIESAKIDTGLDSAKELSENSRARKTSL
jgi:hypothetical protein